MSIFSKIIGDPNARFLKKVGVFVDSINEIELDFEALSDEELKGKTLDFKKRLKGGEALDDLMIEAFALVREAAKRTLGQRHYDVQLIGGIILHQGKIAEMKTGEGKTLVATLAAYLNALEGKGVHVITVNDYLSRRDAVWMGQVYSVLGLSVGCLNHEASYIYDSLATNESSEKNTNHKTQNEKDNFKELDKERDALGSFKIVHEFLRPCSRKEAYNADITYGTNNEFGFDFLRDNLSYNKEQVVQRGHNFVIIDEIDSVLIDEARTPLIISAPTEKSEDFYITFSKIANQLKEGADYEIDEKMKAISLTEDGINHAEKLLGINDIYTEKGIRYVHHLETAVRAKALFKLDRDYVVKNGEIIIVDEFTGRMMPGRRWSEGLHQAVEAKESVQIQKESRTMASITFQNYFRDYVKLSGMTGTALTSAEEFHKVYKLETVVVPTNKTLVRKDRADLIFQSDEGKTRAIVNEIKEKHQKGQPILVGTVSIQKNEYLSSLLKREGVPHKVLNAKHHEEEAEIIAQAGKRGAVTIATNMAGRGVDIVLGGNPKTNKSVEEVMNIGGLYVLGTERHEARRIDNQLRGRAGRQGDPGETCFFVSLDDDLMRIFGSDRIKGMMEKFGIPEDQPIENKLVSRAIESAQSKIEGFNFDARKHLLEYDDVMNHQRNIIYKRRKDILFGDNEFIIEALKKVFSSVSVEQKDEYGNIISSEEFKNYIKKLEEKREELGEENFFRTQKAVMLQAIDMLWVEHLEVMDYMRSSVRLRAYGQRDPLVEYKNEGLKLFRQLEFSINHTIAEQSLKIGVQIKTEDRSVVEMRSVNEGNSLVDLVNTNKESSKNAVGRNELCPCGSGKKYKRCHGA